MNNGQLSFPLYENKDNIKPIPKTKIVEAYGLGKCDKLIEQVSDDELPVRVNALAVLCDEFYNPYVISGCTQGGIIKILSAMITDPDHTTRLLSSKALYLMANDANGLNGIIEEENVITEILYGINDNSTQVRSNIYQCFANITRTMDGIIACVHAGVTKEFVLNLVSENDDIKLFILQTIYNTCKIEQGLSDALSVHVIEILIELLRHTVNISLILSISNTLGFICFSNEAKRAVIHESGVTILINILKEITTEEVIHAITYALMVISNDDDSKIELCDCDGISVLIRILSSPSNNRLVQLNILKIMSNVAVYPHGRKELILDTRGLEIEQLMELALESRDEEETGEGGGGGGGGGGGDGKDSYGDDEKEGEGEGGGGEEGKDGSNGYEKRIKRKREILARTPHISVTGLIKRLHDKAVETGDSLMAKHASIALQAVQWTP